MNKEEYILLNRAIIITGLLLWCFFYFTGGTTCAHLNYTGEECGSCGVTRDMLSFLKLDFINPINSNSINLFLFGVLQFSYRLFISALKSTEKTDLFEIIGFLVPDIKKVIIADAMITFLLIVAVFLPFWL